MAGATILSTIARLAKLGANLRGHSGSSTSGTLVMGRDSCSSVASAYGTLSLGCMRARFLFSCRSPSRRRSSWRLDSLSPTLQLLPRECLHQPREVCNPLILTRRSLRVRCEELAQRRRLITL